jgi:hypothetical protein
LGCDKLPPLKEISSRDLERLEIKWVWDTLKGNLVPRFGEARKKMGLGY